MSIEPDTKDWTWVLSQKCPECGLTASDVVPTEIGAQVRADLPRWAAVLARPDVRDRPSPDVWSPHEYACHVRDVYVLFAERVEMMLDRDDPMFPNWDQDATAIEHNYAAQDPEDVAEELTAAGDVIARVFDNVAADSWDRTGRRSDGSAFTVATLGQYFMHDIVHHLHDVRA
ncbi:DinB family protein [Aeromicrobium sp.]|uniref:DinB family protein n=1 Tax=Aeromicrobium sp. TaxID=1871063 RepID=UPI002FCC1BCB